MGPECRDHLHSTLCLASDTTLELCTQIAPLCSISIWSTFRQQEQATWHRTEEAGRNPLAQNINCIKLRKLLFLLLFGSSLMLNLNSTTELHPPQEIIYLFHALVPSSIKPGWCSHLPSQGQTLGQHIQNVTTSSTHISPHWNVNGHKVGTWLYSQWHFKGLTFCLNCWMNHRPSKSLSTGKSG